MNRIKHRSLAALILVFAVFAGLVFYIVRYVGSGAKWASFMSNSDVYSGGVLKVGTVVDRNGVMLADIKDGKRVYADDATIRKATLHAVGDTSNNIGTGALSAFASKLIGYNSITGAYSYNGKGSTLSLSIDATLNAVAYKALAGKSGAVGVYNYKTGEILCMVSTPTYDPADPPDIQAGDDQYDGVYINRFLSSTFTPGSVFKLVTLAAAIETIPDLHDRTFTCNGSYKIGGDTITCPETHGKLHIEDALADSCNIAFGQLSLELGGDLLRQYATRYGLLSTHSVDGITTAKGSFEVAKAGSADLAWSGVGQFNDVVNPCAMLRLVGSIANGGVAMEPRLIHQTGLAEVLAEHSERLMKKETADAIATMMNYDVYQTYGTKNFPGLDLYAKSGTAQVGGDKLPNAWFVGFIRNENAPLAFVVVVENGGGGSSVAGAVANKVLQAAIAK